MVIKKNTVADNTARMYNTVTSQNADCAEKLITGFQINHARDNVAYFHISEKMRGQIRGLMMADRNCQDGISMVQTASAAFDEVGNIMQRGKELSVRAANATLADADREAANDELNQLKEELEKLNETTFNTISVFSESGSLQTKQDAEHNSVVFQVGPLAGQYVSVHLFSMSVEEMGLSDTDLTTQENAEKALSDFDDAMEYVNAKRSYYGAIQGRLEHALEQVEGYSNDMTNAETRIRETNMEKTMVHYATTHILMESGVSMMVQANQGAKGVMSLLGWL